MIKLEDFNEMRNDPRVRFKTEEVDGHVFTIVAYMISDSKFWTDYKYSLETRGITFNSNGEVVSRPFNKFFNVNEREETLLHNLDMNYAKFFEKRDGSMVHPVIVGNRIVFKSKKSFYSDVAIAALKNASSDCIDFCWEMMNDGYTPIFEYTDPNHQIVIDYGKTPEFVLLACRHTKNGFMMPYNELKSKAKKYNVKVIQHYDIDEQEALQVVEESKNFEGYVVYHIDGKVTKWKTKWYLTNHHLMTELRVRDVAVAFYEEKLDDLKSFVVSEGHDISKLNEIETRIANQIASIITDTNDLARKIQAEPTRKDAALKYSKEKLFSLAIKVATGEIPSFRDYWYRNHKNDYDLSVVYNKTFRADDQ